MDLSHLDLSQIDFRQADFSGTIARQTDFSGSSFYGVDVSCADFGESVFCRSSLHGVFFHATNVRGADFRGASWQGLMVSSAPVGELYLLPTRQGWEVQAATWSLTMEQIRRLLAGDGKKVPAAEYQALIPILPVLEALMPLLEEHIDRVQKRLPRKLHTNFKNITLHSEVK
ncbi:pentapeptide repeat-containing protein [Corynebacterium mastitidis]|uniref:pentapeptide repeat-containing protein n=1 Tax=Corynebacterium mastitidis TaxID=161890 RepID=UPI0014613275|nr:pentapeptide repeat-containing protein [Corynebacterium mastitidis]